MIFGNVENNSCRHAADLLLTKGRVQLRKKKNLEKYFMYLSPEANTDK